MKIFKNIVLDIIIIFLIILVVSIFSGFIQLNIMNKDYCDIFGFTLFKVSTGSMIPTLQIGDIIIVKLTDNVQENDIVTYVNDNKIITHRIIEIKENDVITKGDNNNTQDKPISKTDIIGKLVFSFNNVSVWKKVFSDIRVIIPIIISIVLLFVLTAYREKVGENNDG